MNAKRLVLGMFLVLGVSFQSLAQVSTCVAPPANALLNANNSVNTCGVFTTIPANEQHALGLIDVSSAVADAAGARADVTATTGMTKTSDWLIGNLGNLYGVTIDEQTAEFYAAASSNFSSTFGFGGAQRTAVLTYGALGGGDNATGSGAIYKFDAVTGVPTLFTTLPQESVTYTATWCEVRVFTPGGTTFPVAQDQARNNVGVGLGNIVWDTERDQMFAVNWEDGRIYRLDAAGTILDAYDPDGTNDDGSAGFAGLTIPYGLTLSPDGTRLFYGTMDRRVLSIDLAADGSFPGTSSSVTVAGVTFDSFEDATETLHITVDDAADADLTRFISDLEFNPNGDLIIGTRTGCPLVAGSGDFSAAFPSSYNHDGATFIVQDNGAGLLSANLFEPNISYDTGGVPDTAGTGGGSLGEPVIGNDGYGGVDYYVAPDGTFDYVFSYADIILESSPHGLAVFSSEDAADTTPVSPLGGISYYEGTNGQLDVKGVGGDVQVYQQFSCPIVGSIQGNVSQDTTGDGNGDTNLPNVVLQLFLDEDGDGLADGPAIASTTTDANGDYSFDNLLENNYLVVETQPANLANVSENEGGDDNDQVAATTVNVISAVVSLGETDTGNDFVEEEGVCIASSHTITFDEYPLVNNANVATTFIDSEYATGGADNTNSPLPAGQGFTVTAAGVGTGQAVFYNTNTGTGGADPDLVGSNSGNGLIVQENAGGVPDDSVGGIITFDFEAPLVEFSATLIDFESVNTALVFTDTATGNSVVVSYADLLDPASPFFQPGAALGDGNVLVMSNPITAADLGLTNFDQVAFDTSGVPTGGGATSGGIDTISFSHACGSLSGNVSQDTNNDGNGDTNLPNVGLELFTDPNGDGDPADGVSVGTTTTDANGNYVFESLIPSDYVVVETQPAGLLSVSENEGGADNDQNGPTAINAISATVDIGENDSNNDFVEIAAGAWTGNVSQDTTGDGNGDTNIANVGVELFTDPNGDGNPADGVSVGTTTTDANGNYVFNNLLPDDYVVVETQPAGLANLSENEGGADNDQNGATPVNTISGTVDPGETDVNNDFVEVALGTWTGNVSQDTTGDGNGDTNLANVGIELFTDPNGDGDPADGVSVGTTTTDANGDYSFTGLAAGNYVAVQTQPTGLDNISENEGGADNDRPNNGILNAVAGVVDPGETDVNNDFVEGAPAIRLEKSLVAFDAANDVNSNGIPDAGDTLSYAFEVFNEGVTDLSNITISDAKLGLTNAACAPGSIAVNGASITCTFEDSYTITSADVTAGFVVNTATTNADSASPVDGTPGTPVSDVSDTGTEPSDPEAVTDVPNPDGTETPNPETPTDGDTTNDPTTALLVQTGAVSGNVSQDTTGDGNGDTNLANVTLELFTDPNGDGDSADGVSQGTTTTDANGDYSFTGLAAGNYVAVQTQPTGLDNISENEGGADNDRPNNGILNAVAGVVDPGETDVNNDFVEGAPAIRLEKSLVAFDAANDVNSNGIPDAGDTLSYAFEVFNEGVTDLSNITISDAKLGLTNAACAPGSIAVNGASITCTFEDSYTITSADVTAGFVVNTATTNADSASPVDGTPGTPVSDVSDTGTEPSDPEAVTDVPNPDGTETPNPETPTDGDTTNDPTTALLVQTGAISGNVSQDTTGDGNGDTNLANVTLELFTDPNGDGDSADGVSQGTTTTDANGNYIFDNLLFGSYVVVETQPTGLDNVSENEGGADNDRPDNGIVNSIAAIVDASDPEVGASTNEDVNNDFVEVAVGTWTGNVSQDTTGDGNGDTNLANVGIELFTDPNGDGDPADGVSVGTTTTDANGDYSFTGLAAGNYVAVQTQPTGLDNISENEGGADNDRPNNGILNAVAGVVDPGETDVNNDFVEGAPAIRLEKSLVAFDAANDVNSNGIPDAGDTLSYAFEVFNEGVTDLSNITITDAKLGLTNAACAPGSIAVNGASITCTFEDSYTITPADVTAGFVVNTATTNADSASPVDGTPGTPVTDVSDTGTEPSDPEAVTDVPNPDGTETPSPETPTDGDTTNDPTTALLVQTGAVSGNVSQDTTGDGNGDTNLANVTLELFTDPNGDGDSADGVSQGTTTTDANGNYIFDDLLFGNYIVVETQPAGLDSISENEGGADNDRPNNGSLNSIAVIVDASDPEVGASTNEDINNDFVEGAPAIRLEKSLVAFDAANDVNSNGIPDAGDTLSYAFEVFNEGVTDLSNITITDAKLGLTNAACAPGSIAVNGASITCTFEDSYTITPADVTAGFVVNTATTNADSASPVDGTPGTPVSDVSDTGTEPSDPEAVTDVPNPDGTETPNPETPTDGDTTNDPTTALLVQTGAISGNVSQDTTGDGNGDTNLANVTLELFTDPNGDGDSADGVSQGTTTTDANGNYIFDNLLFGSYVVVETQPTGLDNVSENEGGADNDRPDNGIVNSIAAIVDASDPEVGASTNEDVNNDFVEVAVGTWTGNVSQDTTGDGNGDTNLANVGIELFTDPNGDGDPADGVSVGTTTTDANGDYSFTGLAAGNYVAVQTQPTGLDNISENEGGADNDRPNNGILNAVAGVVDPGETDVNNDFVEGAPAIRLEKSLVAFDAANDVNSNGIPDAGDTLSYAFEVFNEGVTDLSNITISDAKLGLTNAACAPGSIAVNGASITCTFEDSYTITSADVTAGFVVNTATTNADSASPVDGTPGTPVSDVSDTGTEPSDPEAVTDVPNPDGTETPNPETPTDGDTTNDPTTALLVQTGAISGNVSQDTTGDGNGDTNLANVTLELFTDPNGDGDSADGVSQGTTTTDANGNYIFDNLLFGSYVVVETQPTGLDNVSENEGGADNDRPDNGIVNSIAAIVDASDPEVGASTNEDVNNDFVEVAVGTWTGNVSQDTTGDGNGDTNLANVGIELFTDPNGDGDPADGVSVGTTTTDANGDYSFTGLAAGNYVAVQTQPTGLDNISENEGGADNDRPNNGILNAVAGVVDPGETDVNNDFVEGAPAIRLEKSLVAFDAANDVNSNGIPDAGDTLSYAFEVFNEGVTDLSNITISDAKLGLTNAACAPGSIAVNGASITCTFEDSYTITSADVTAGFVVNTATTNADSASPVDGTPGTPVSDVSDTGTEPSDPEAVTDVPNPDGTETPNPETPTDGDTTNDPTTALLVQTGAVSGNVSQDTTGDGNGDTNLANVTLELFTDPNGDGDSADGVSQGTTTTDANGNYIFDNLLFGSYVVVETQPTGLDNVSENEGGADNDRPDNGIVNSIAAIVDASDPEVGASTNEDVNNDFVEVAVGTWTGNVSQDTTGDGNGDTNLANVGIELFTDPNGDGDPADGVSVGTTTTDANGDYSFTGLAAGNYVAVQTQPTGLDNISENEGGADNDRPNNGILNAVAGVVDPGETDVNNDFVEGAPAIRLEKSLVAFDAANDVNSNGIPDAGDTLSYAFEVFNEGVTDLSNITISDAKLGLTNAACAPGSIAVNGASITCTFEDSYTITSADVTAGFVVNTATTNADSASPVDGTPGTPVSDVSDTGTEPSDPEAVTDVPNPDGTETPNPETPTDGDTTNDPTTALLVQTGAVSGNVSQDTTGDGNGDTNLANVTLELFTDPNGDGDSADGVSQGTTTTDANGNYIFDNLLFGSYVVVETQPTGLDNVSENEGGADNDRPDNGIVNSIAAIVDASDPEVGASTNEDVNNDFVEVLLGSIGDTVYLDWDADGVQDAGEPGIAGVTVQLMRPDGSIAPLATTDANGQYSFGNLPAGSYMVTVITSTLDGSLTNGSEFFNTGDPDTATEHSAGVTGPVAHAEGHPDNGDGIIDPGEIVEGDNKSTYVLGAGENNVDQDFGYHPVIVAEDDVFTTPSTGVNVPDECIPTTFFEGGEALANTAGNSSSGSILSFGGGRDSIAGGQTADVTSTAVDLDPSTPAIDNVFSVPGEGQWEYLQTAGTVNGVNYLAGTLIFTPEDQFANDPNVPSGQACFEGNPTPLTYVLYELVDLDGDGSVGPVLEYGDRATLSLARVTTPVNISFVQIEEGVSGNAVIRWTADLETSNLGYMVYQRTPEGWVELNAELIPSKAFDSIEAAEYEFRATGVTGQWFAIADVDAQENVTPHGPYRMGQTYGSETESVEGVDWSTINSASNEALDVNTIQSRIQRLKSRGAQ